MCIRLRRARATPLATDMAPQASEPSLIVNRAKKTDRRLAWGWEPFDVTHGRKAIAMNWSGLLWSMPGPFAEQSNFALPKVAFTPSDDLELLMTDASQFLLPEPISQVPENLYAQRPDGIEAGGAPEGGQAVDEIVTGSTAMAYAPTSVEALEAPFRAILTEQRKGRISEENQVTIVDPADDTKGKTDVTLASLPRARVPKSPEHQDTGKSAGASKPLDISPLVADRAQPATGPDGKAESPAKSKAEHADLKLASIKRKEDSEEEQPKKSRFARWFSFGSKPKKAKIVTKGEHAWVANKLPKSSFTKKQKKCLANAIYFESRSEPVDGQIAVAQVVMNRVKNPTYPNTICGVVYQNQHKRNACQFSFACDRIPDRIRSKKAWDLAWKISNQVVNGEVWLKSIGSSTHYHATYVNPRWARTMKRRKKIGLHIFYKTYGGGWS